ncbi:hypothetical protein BD324DRAFT_455377 [Kockovaella imperatae]|uniref:Uncharacterized protein n=1 Tax=Kockovaella imperatae TaxID=4999 RepID=A0A1Y1UEV6_9TREE|nr:hypothetical protein BD324DRAFT_455377 [Kockovaella imperatae]ORX36601.1 hypothetical protein BD324DRAFT_455377 [Kockovaella imperatae]
MVQEHNLPAPSRKPLPNLISAFLPGYRANHSSQSTSTPANPDPVPLKPPAMKRPRGGHAIRKPAEAPQIGLPIRPNGRDLKSIEPNGEEGAPVRRSSRLKSGGPGLSSMSAKDKRTTRSRSATSSTSGATIENPPSPQSQELALQAYADDWLRDIVRKCARAYRALSTYSCQETLREIDTLPGELQASPWALDMISRAFYEMANYIFARRAFKALLKVEPYALQSMEMYSTLLWHLGDPPALSFLSQKLISIDRNAPQPWIAAGNCFSLQKDHDEAMRCFRRATQVDPGCAYAWTLCGYEAIEMEEYERAVAFYRTAIRTDARHYNAWYGMGLVYLKTGKPKYAEHHFRRAAEINPTNAVLLTCIGMVLEQNDDTMQALSFYDQACKYAPDSPMVAYKRVRVLVALQRIDEAITFLESLAKTAPDEANIHFLLAKCYLKQDRRTEATVSFTSARELQPKLEGAIRAAIGGKEEDEEDDEEM